MNKLLIQAASIIDPVQKKIWQGDVLISQGRIEQMAEKIKVPADATIMDAKGLHLAPGFWDIHTHLREPGFEYKETIESGARAAAAGGFTTICCMANTEPVNDNGAITQYILEKAKKAVVRVFPIGAISKSLAGECLAEMGEMKEAGIVAVSDDGRTIMSAQLMRLGMEYADGFSLPVITHCIDAHLGGKGCMHEGDVSVALGLPGIPAEAEEIMIARDIKLAELTGAHLHVAHLSTAGGLELVRAAKAKGLRVTCEVAPHHFTLTHEACRGYNTYAKMCPPLRTQQDVAALIIGLADGSVDAIATDHAPHAIVDKEVEFENAAMGIIGLETAFPLAYDLVLQNKLSLLKLIELLTTGPAHIVAPQEKLFVVGARADFTLLDLNQKWECDVSQSFSKSRNSPFHGKKFQGKVVKTIVEGKIVYGK